MNSLQNYDKLRVDSIYAELKRFLDEREEPITSSYNPEFGEQLGVFIVSGESEPFFDNSSFAFVESIKRIESRRSFVEALRIAVMVRYGTRHPKPFNPSAPGHIIFH